MTMDFRLEQVDDQHIAGVHEARMSDLKAVVEDCTARRSLGNTGSSEIKHVARVPAIIVQKYINDNGITYAEFMRDPKHADRMLSDPSLSAFRIWEGRI
jgi:hypothetical protein